VLTLSNRRTAGTFITSVACAGLLAGCGDPSPQTSAAPTDGLSVVVGAHANAPAPTLLDQAQAFVNRAAERQAQAAVIVDDKVGTVVAQGPLTVKAKNKSGAKKAVGDQARLLSTTITTAAPRAGEVDLLHALDLAARALSAVRGSKTILVVDSGLQTSGALRFQDPGMLSADPGEVADLLEHDNALPDLDGTEMVFSGLGDTASPQRPLTTALRKNVVAVWTAIAERAGAKVTVLEAPLTAPSRAGLPAVMPVPVPTVGHSVVPAEGSARVLELSQQTVAFVSDSSAYLDPATARKALMPLARQIRDRGAHVRLTGATASAGTAAGRARLSLARADAVKRTLVELGVSASQISTSGVGSDWPGYLPDRDRAGQLVPALAAQNRKVLVELK
jgi:outer membrane protein OmpA-like peptidoglycan-associated protein